MPLTVNITEDQKVTLHSNPKTISGSPAAPFGPCRWSVVDAGPGLNLQVNNPATDGLSAVATPSGGPGTRTVRVEADVVSGGPVKSDTYTIVVAAGQLDHFAPSNDPPVPIGS